MVSYDNVLLGNIRMYIYLGFTDVARFNSLSNDSEKTYVQRERIIK